MLIESTLILAMVFGSGNSMTVESNGVRVESVTKAQVYSWTITNVDAEPIMSVSVSPYNTYNPNVPGGWEFEFDGDHLKAWVIDPRFAIRPGQSRTFETRGGSSGAMLGTMPVTVGFQPREDDVIFEHVWGPVPRPRNIVVVVATMLMALGLLHVALLRRAERRSQMAA